MTSRGYWRVGLLRVPMALSLVIAGGVIATTPAVKIDAPLRSLPTLEILLRQL